jgi:hypothetical protein
VDAETLWLWVSANQDGDDGLRLTVCSNVNVSLRNIEVVETSRSFSDLREGRRLRLVRDTRRRHQGH